MAFINIIITYLACADNLVLLAEDRKKMEMMLRTLESYCQENELEVNTNKTKIMIAYKGSLSSMDSEPFYFNNANLERVKKYKYLGLWFAQQLSLSDNIKVQTAKANARIGWLWQKFYIQKLSLDLAMKIFRCYIQPLVSYGIEIWLDMIHKNKNNITKLNTILTLFLKRWLMIPRASNIAFLHHVTGVLPFNVYLDLLFRRLKAKLRLPHLQGYLVELGQFNYGDFKGVEGIPSYFWTTRSLHNIPKNVIYRKRICREIFVWDHDKYCGITRWHNPYLHGENGQFDSSKVISRRGVENCCYVVCGSTRLGFNHQHRCKDQV